MDLVYLAVEIRRWAKVVLKGATQATTVKIFALMCITIVICLTLYLTLGKP